VVFSGNSYGAVIKPGIQDTLAAASGNSELVGIEHKDAIRVTIAIQAELKKIQHEQSMSIPVDFGTLKAAFREIIVKEDTIFQPINTHIFYQEAKSTPDGIQIHVMARIKDDKHGMRTYYAVFSMLPDELGGFPVKVYTEKQYKAEQQIELSDKDKKTLERELQHQAYDENVIKWAHDHNLAIQVDISEHFDEIIEKANIGIDGGENIRQRPCYLIPFDSDNENDEILKRVNKYTVTILDEEGNEKIVSAFAHSSNHSIHIILPKDYVHRITFRRQKTGWGFMWDVYERKDFPEKSDAEYETYRRGVEGWNEHIRSVYGSEQEEAIGQLRRILAHEIGVMVGSPVKRFYDSSVYAEEFSDRIDYSSWPQRTYLVNEIDERYSAVENPDRERFKVVDLDTNLPTRDYAMGWFGKTPQEKALIEFREHAPEMVLDLVGDTRLKHDDIDEATHGRLTKNARRIVEAIMRMYYINSKHIPDADLARLVSATWAHGRTFEQTNTRQKLRVEKHPVIIDAVLKIQGRAAELAQIIGPLVVTQLSREVEVPNIYEALDMSTPKGRWVSDEDFDKIIAVVDSGRAGKGSAYITQVAREARMPFELIIAIRQSGASGNTENIIEQLRKIFKRTDDGELDLGVVEEALISVIQRLSNEDYPDLDGSKLEDILREGLLAVRSEGLPPPIQKITTRAIKEISTKEMKTLANEVGLEIAPPAKQYTIFASKDLYMIRSQYEHDKVEYADRFNLEWITTDRANAFLRKIKSIIKQKQLDPTQVIVQLPAFFAKKKHQNKLETLAGAVPGIKLMVIDTKDFLQEDPEARARYRKTIYSTLLLARHINEDTPVDSNVYRLLEYFISSLIGEDQAASLSDYISSLRLNDIVSIVSVVKTILTYKPAERVEAPNPDIVAAALISA
jgi:hypothetical protein